MTLPIAETTPASAGSGAERSRLLLLDPISHAFGDHDAALARELRALGFDVTVGGNDFRNGNGIGSPGPAEGGSAPPYRGVVGDASRIRKLVNHWRSRNRILRSARSGGFDAVVLYYVLQPEIDATLLAALRGAGLPALAVAHDVIPLHRDRDRLGAWGRVWRSAGAVVALSAHAREELIARCRVPAERIHLGRLGLPPAGDGSVAARDRARRRLGIDGDGRTVLCFGQLRPNKDLTTLIRGFAAVAGANPDAKLRIVGRPWRYDVAPVRRLVGDLGVEDRVVFHLGWVRDDDVPAWFEAADLVAVSYNRIYQSDIVLKAAAHRRPVVASAVGDTPELIRDGATGWLVRPGDDAGFGRALEQALGNPREASRRAAALAEDAGGRHAWSALAAVIRDALRSLPERSRDGREGPR